MKAFQNFINGKYVDAADGRTTAVINPATGEQYATAPLSGAADIDDAMQAAAAAFDTWRDSDAERAVAGAVPLRRRRRIASRGTDRARRSRTPASRFT